MSKLECRGIGKKYGKKETLQQIDLTIESGKIYGLIGRNGAGKTTLLSIMAAQNPASQGMVMLDGENIWENQKALGNICFSREISPASGKNGIGSLRIKEYLKAAAIYLPKWDAQMAGHLIEMFALNPKQRMSKISKGMLSMVTIIVAMASKAEYTFLDEPVTGLDAVMRERFYQILLNEYADTGRTFVISTHIIEEAANIFEEVILLKKGCFFIKENTQHLMERALHISGRTEQVGEAVEGLVVCQEEIMGRSKGVTVLLEEGQTVKTGFEVTVQPVSLQNLFVALCGKED